jgi:outer membrane protein insertion porin family
MIRMSRPAPDSPPVPFGQRRLLAVLLLVAWAAAPARSAAQSEAPEPYIGRVVSEVRLVSAGIEVADSRLRSVLDVQVGRALSVSDVRESIIRLMGMGRFQDVRVDASVSPSGVAVVFDLVPLRDVKRVVFRGDLGLPETVIRAAVVDRFGPTPAKGRANDIASALEEFLRGRGFLRARVTPVAAADLVSEAGDLAFDIAAGPPARILEVILNGPDPDLLGSLPQRLQVHVGDRYDPVALQARVEQYLDEWHRGGYYEARLERTDRVNDARDGVTLTLMLDRGPVVIVEFQGDPLLPKERAELVPVTREGTVDEDLLEDSERRIADYLHAQGYRDARAVFARSEVGGRLRIVFTVTRGPLYKVAGVELPPVSSMSQPELRGVLKVAQGQVFVQSRLDADVANLAAEYRRRGYVDAKISHKETVLPAPAPDAAERLVTVAIDIVEGPRTLVGTIVLRGNTAVPTARLESSVQTRQGQPFNGGTIDDDKERLLVAYLNLGYRSARIDLSIVPSEDRTLANVEFAIHEGPQIIVDHILIVGNQHINENTIRHEIALRPGEPLGLAGVNETQQRLAALGLFRRVTISELQHRAETRRDVLVTVDEAPSTTLGYGGGVEFQNVERSEFAPRGFFELGRRNLWGKNRSVNLYSRLSVRRRGANTATAPYSSTEYRVVGSYREPRFLLTKADLQASVLFEQGSRTSFSFRRRSARVELSRRFGKTYTLAGQYALERNDLLEERLNPRDKPLIDRLFPSVRLSTFSLTAVRDSRDDQIDPSSGFLFGINGDLALEALGSQIGFAKTFVQAFTYNRLPLERRVIFAAGARVGLGVGFPRTVPAPLPDPVLGASVPATVTVRDLPANERFFAGGDTTVRGFQLDHLGTAATFDRDGQPIGGHAMAVFNAELRMDLWRDIGVVGFMDVGNVFAKASDFGVGHLRAGAGFGIRYKSPVGPLRLDLGFKLGTLLTFASTRESRTALHISIGQAF